MHCSSNIAVIVATQMILAVFSWTGALIYFIGKEKEIFKSISDEMHKTECQN